MGSDYAGHASVTGHRHFNPRSPDGERLFLVFCSAYSSSHFNPRSPDGERPPRSTRGTGAAGISIHAPRMGSDGGLVVDGGDLHGFQSTLPGWGATRAQAFERVLDDAISIHAPRMGSDQGRHPPSLPATHFNPRSPDGERPRKWTSSPTIWAKSSIFNTDCIADRR